MHGTAPVDVLVNIMEKHLQTDQDKELLVDAWVRPKHQSQGFRAWNHSLFLEVPG